MTDEPSIRSDMLHVVEPRAAGLDVRKGSQFAGFHRALTARMGYKRAILATAYKLLRTAYAVLRDDHHYRDPGIDYEQLQVQRNAPRWIAKLTKFGYLEASAPTA